MAIWCGIDIGTASVKVAVVRSAYRKMSLDALVAVDVTDSSSAGVAECIRAAVLAALGGRTGAGDGMAVALPGAKAAVRTVMLPASAQKQLGEVLAFELEAQVPFDMDGSVFDWRVLAAPRSGDKEAQVEVLAAVARIDDVRARIELVKTAIDMEPERVGVGAFPLSNLAQYTTVLAEPGPVVMLDLGRVSSEVLVIRGGEAVFARTLSYGTEGLPQTAPKLARDVRTSIAAFRAAGGEAPTMVYLCGGVLHVPGAEAFLAGELQLPVVILPPPALDMTLLSPEAQADTPRFAKAIGLALGLSGRGGGLNLRRGPLVYERGFGWIREKVPVLAGLAAVLLVSFLFSAWTQVYAISKDEDASEKALASVTREVLGEETSSAERANELLSQQTNVSDEDPMPHGDAFDVMVRLSEAIPESMVHDIEELDVQKGHVVVHGIVGSIPDAQSIAQTLTADRCFQDVKVTRTTQVVGGERQKYVLEFDIKCPEDMKGKKKDSASTAAGQASAASAGGGGK